MKNFKRKLARLFGLALRSDLERVTHAYNSKSREEYTSYNEARRFNRLWRDTQEAFNQYIRNND